MERTKASTLAAIASVSTAVCLIGLRLVEMRGGAPVGVPPLITVVLLAVALIVLGLGWRVRRFTHGRGDIDPIVAARILALAKACAVVGAIQLGYLLAQLFVVLPHLGAPEARSQAWASGVGAVASLVLVGAALVAEWWCRVPKGPDDDDRDLPPDDDAGVLP